MNVEAPDLQNEYGIHILVGDNGSGKSRILNKLATQFYEVGHPVFAIANTLHHRFPRHKSRRYHLHVPANGGNSAEKVIKKSLQDNYEEIFYAVGKVLQYCGFAPFIRIRLKFPDNVFWRNSAKELNDYLEDTDAFTRDEILELKSTISTFLYRSRDGRSQDIYFDSLSERSRALDVMAILKFGDRLKKARVILGLELLVSKGETLFPLSEASSGEISLLSTYIALSSHITVGTVILVDEPENSLHPHWQTEYCRRLLDLFHWYRPMVVMATHSPLIVSAATSDAEPARVLQVVNGRVVKTVASTKSVEGTLWNTFETLPPGNHWLSESLVNLLERLSKKQITIDDVANSVKRYQDQSYDEKQKEFLVDFVHLAEKVSRGEPLPEQPK